MTNPAKEEEMNGAKRLLSVGYAWHVRRGRGWMPRIDAARQERGADDGRGQRLEIDGRDGERSLIDCLSFDRELERVLSFT